SQPCITCPPPRKNTNGSRLSMELSNFSPLLSGLDAAYNQPVSCTVTLKPASASRPSPTTVSFLTNSVMPVLIEVFSSVDDLEAAVSEPALQPVVATIASASTPAKNDICFIKTSFSEGIMIPESL